MTTRITPGGIVVTLEESRTTMTPDGVVQSFEAAPAAEQVQNVGSFEAPKINNPALNTKVRPSKNLKYNKNNPLPKPRCL